MRIPKSAMQFLLAAEAVLLIVVLMLCIISPFEKENTNNNSNTTISHNSDNVIDKNAGGNDNTQENNDNNDSGEIPEFQPSQEVTARLEEMTLEEKVAQLFLISPEALTGSELVTVAGKTTKEAINNYPVGGLVYSEQNFKGKEQTKSMLSGVQGYVSERIGIPMFLVVKEQGGETSPLAKKNGYTSQPSITELVESKEPETGAESTAAIAAYLKEEGFNMNIAPNVDTAVLGEDVSKGAQFISEIVSAYNANGIMTLTGSFPGLGNDSSVDKQIKEWEEADGLLYRAGITAGTQGMIIGGVTAPDFTKDDSTLCCFSAKVTKYLRVDMKFTGLLITDNLSDKRITDSYTSAEAAVEALKAGMTMLYCPEKFSEAYQGVLAAVENGSLSEDIIDEAVARILTCKEKLTVAR